MTDIGRGMAANSVAGGWRDTAGRGTAVNFVGTGGSRHLN